MTEDSQNSKATTQAKVGSNSDVDVCADTHKPSVSEPQTKENGLPAQPVRAINEDDDGYDPYSDLHDHPSPEPLFERDPWD